MLKTKFKDSDAIDIPPKIAKKFALKDGIVVEAKVVRGKLLILRKKNKIRNFMQFAGMWQNENVDMVFSKIRKDWDKWQKELSV